jgi:small subunit ribosomal protein S13
MVYLFETEILSTKLLPFALMNIYGIGEKNSFFFCKKLGFAKNLILKDLSKEQLNKLVKSVESSGILIAGDLLKTRIFILKKLVSIKSYRGLRRYQGLPIRGQRTHTNARTARKKFR